MKKPAIHIVVINIACLLFIACLIQVPVQEAVAQYAHSMGGDSFDRGVEAGMDAAGNAYFIGEFTDTLDFDPGPGEYPLKNFNRDVFIVSYDELGALRFAFELSGNAASHEGAGDIAVADDGSFVVTGHQPFGWIDFDPDPLEETVRTGELFIAGYTHEGKVRFAVSPNGGQNTSSGGGNAVALDQEGNVYVTGFFVTSLDFNPADSTGILPNAGSSDAFIASYDAFGNYRYAYSFGGDGFDFGSGITVDGHGNLFVAGFFNGEAFFDPEDTDGNGNTEPRTSLNNSDMFLASYDKDGKFRFVYTFDNSSRVEIERKIALSVDASDNIYMSGESNGTIAFDPEDADGNGNLVYRTAEGLGSAFLASYRASGVIRFATVLKGGSSYSRDVFTNKNGVSFITGAFTGDVDFDPNVDDAVISSSRGSDVFVASYDSIGAYRMAFNLPSTGLSAGVGIATDSLYNIALTGGFGGDFDIQHDAGEDWRTSTGQDDIFMARFEAAGQVSVALEPFDGPSDRFDVSPPYPNPFSAQTNIKLSIPESQLVQISIFDALGRRIDRIQEGLLTSGTHEFVWNGGNVSNGLYFIRIENGASSEVHRVFIIR